LEAARHYLAPADLTALGLRPHPPGVRVLLRALERPHANAKAHADAVASLALRIGRRLGLDDRSLDDLTTAGALHDIGKLSVPAQILNKPGPLSDKEWRIVRAHPAEGERLLRPLVERSGVLEAVRWHHERWDGGGYPDGLPGEATPVAARIIAVADAYSAMVEERPYRPALSRNEAVAELERHSAGQFDPTCVAVVEDAVTVTADGTAR
jgi:HD-GYP domain-containing protein (c-di-GMP phosphodiesterase class II)